MLIDVDAQRAGYKDARLGALTRDLLARATQTSGVVAASASENGLFSGTESATNMQVEGFTARSDDDSAIAYDDVGPAYFKAIGAHMLQGRDFEERDNESGAKVAVLNETAARFFFPHGSAIGSHVTTDSSTFEIVGVVGMSRNRISVRIRYGGRTSRWRRCAGLPGDFPSRYERAGTRVA